MSSESYSSSSGSSGSSSGVSHRSAASFLALAVVLSVLFCSYLVYLFLARLSVQKEAEVYQNKTVELRQEVATLREKKVDRLLKAKEILGKVDGQRIVWSKVIHDALTILPKSDKGDVYKAEFISYSGSSDGKLVLSAKTGAGSEAPFQDVADVVSAFVKTNVFKEVFAPTISKSTNEQGQSIVTFVLNLTYHGK